MAVAGWFLLRFFLKDTCILYSLIGSPTGRRGSAPVDLLADSINMYKGNELTDRYRLFQSHPSTPQHKEGSKSWHLLQAYLWRVKTSSWLPISELHSYMYMKNWAGHEAFCLAPRNIRKCIFSWGLKTDKLHSDTVVCTLYIHVDPWIYAIPPESVQNRIE